MIGAITLLGAGWWTLRGSPERSARRRLQRLAVVAWTLLLVGSAAAFGLFGAEAVAGTVTDAFSPAVWADLATTETGRMLLLRVALAAVFGVLLALRRRRAEGWWRGAAFAAAVLTLYSFSAAGHPNAQDPAALWIVVDLAHLGAIAVWLGGLVTLVVIGSAALATTDGEQLARRFSFAATIAVPVIVATGVAQTLRLSGGIDDLTSTDWGRLLLAKVTVVVVLLAIAGVSRWLLHHDGAPAIRRTVVAEALMGIAVVGLAAGMVALPPEAPLAARAFAEQLSANGLIAEVSVSPGRVGTNDVHVVITPPGGSIIPVVAVAARVSSVSAEIPASPVTLVKDGPNHYIGTVTFPRSGDWEFELVVQVTETESVLLKTTVPIP